MISKPILLVILLFEFNVGIELRIKNNCKFTVWPGILGNANLGTPDGGGFELRTKQNKIIQVSNKWGGRVWGRTNCDANGRCVTGDCGNKIACNGAGGVPPVTLAEFTLGGWGDKDYYDISLVDGYNLQMKIIPIGGKRGNGMYDCRRAGCNKDLNRICPNELRVKNSGRTVACLSACEKFRTDSYCCRGAHNKPETCKSSSWEKNYPSIFKKACPEAYSYAYDDMTSTFTCKSNSVKGYRIIFC